MLLSVCGRNVGLSLANEKKHSTMTSLIDHNNTTQFRWICLNQKFIERLSHSVTKNILFRNQLSFGEKSYCSKINQKCSKLFVWNLHGWWALWKIFGSSFGSFFKIKLFFFQTIWLIQIKFKIVCFKNKNQFEARSHRKKKSKTIEQTSVRNRNPTPMPKN